MPYPPNNGQPMVDGPGNLVHAAHTNDIVTELGSDPSGAFASVTARLADIESRLATASTIDPRLGVRLAWENDSTMFSNNSAEQTTFTYSIPAQGNPGGMKWIVNTHGVCTNNSGSSANFSMRCKINGATQVSAINLAVPTGAQDHPYLIQWNLLGDNDWNLNQLVTFRLGGMLAQPNTAPDLFNQVGYARGNTITQPTWAAPLVLTVTLQWSAAATTVTSEYHGHEVIKYSTTPG